MLTPTMKMLPNDTDFTDLEKRAHLDLAKRARGGTIIYLAIWLISAIWVEMLQIDPVFFVVNTLIFVVTALMRVVHYRWLNEGSGTNTKGMYHWLVGILLFSSFHWGRCLRGLFFAETTRNYITPTWLFWQPLVSGALRHSVFPVQSVFFTRYLFLYQHWCFCC